MPVIHVAQIGNPFLREHAHAVDERMLCGDALHRLLANLVDTMRAYRGVGLAAPQVREPVRAFVMEVLPDMGPPPLALHVVLNPELVPLTNDTDDDWESCLSIADLRGRVPRRRAVRLRGLTPEGEELDVELEGFAARVAQHEIDHLDGLLYLDRMPDLRSLTSEAEMVLASRHATTSGA